MINLRYAARGEFRVDAKRGEELVPLAPWQSNLITDVGMDSLASTNSWTHIAVGSGNTTPQFTDTRLASYVAGQSHGGWGGSVLGNVVTFSAVATFGLGAVVGNISELAVLMGGGTSSRDTATRALIMDASGEPTTIAVQAEDQLIVTYRVIFTVDQGISTQSITDPNTGVVYTVRAKYGTLVSAPANYGILGNLIGSASSTGHACWVGGVFGGPGEVPSGGSRLAVQGNQITVLPYSYSPGSYTASSGVRYGTSASALDRDGVNILEIGTYSPGSLLLEFDPPFRKPSTSTATLQFQTSWARG